MIVDVSEFYAMAAESFGNGDNIPILVNVVYKGPVVNMNKIMSSCCTCIPINHLVVLMLWLV